MSNNPPVVADGTVVSFHYQLRDAEDSFNESSDADSPIVYLHGRNNIVPGLETAMTGKRSGDKFTATIAPEQGYGPRTPNAMQRVPIKHLAGKGRPVAGQTVTVNTREGARHGVVVKVGHFNVDLDMNHPLAGKTLLFDIDIVDVRAATEEELAHGHAHGPGGHEH